MGSFHQNTCVFVTGATGFVGAYLVRILLNKGYRVKALKRKESSLDLLGEYAKKIEWVEGDILDFSFLESVLNGVDEVYHLAAIVSFNPKDTQKMMAINIGGTENLVNIALDKGVRKFLYMSSIAALGRTKNKTLIDEKAQWENNSINSSYAISKFKAECEVWRGIQEGLHAVIVNPSVILGAGYWHSGTARMFVRVKKGLNFYPKGATGFVDVRDVARASVLLMESNIKAERFILNGGNISYQNLFTIMSKALKQKTPRWKMPSWGVTLMWRAEQLRARALGITPLITQAIARNLESHYEYSSIKIEEMLHYAFIPIPQTIKETAELCLLAEKKAESFGVLAL